MYSPLLTVALEELSLMAVPWMVKATSVVVALIPATRPLSNSAPVERLEAVVQRATSPLMPAPDRPEPEAAMVIDPAVEVVMVMLAPLTKIVGPYLVPVESAANNWPVWLGAVEVPVPPLPTPKTPLTSAEPKAILPLNRAPEAERTTPVPKEEMVVEPETVKLPVRLVVARVETPVTNKGPETVRAVLDAVAKLVCPVTVRLVKDGLAETAMVEVPEITMFEPWLSRLAISL
jgi:hypothetical protein